MKWKSLKRYRNIQTHHDDVIKWKQFPVLRPFVRGIHRSPVNSPHKGQWRGALMFSLICARINGWVNNGEAGDLRRHRAHYDVIVMYRIQQITSTRQSIQWFCPAHSFILSLINHPSSQSRHKQHPSTKDVTNHHYDVIKWKPFPRCWPFVRGIHWWIPIIKASDAELCCFLWPVHEQTVEQTIDTPVIRDAIALIMVSL